MLMVTDGLGAEKWDKRRLAGRGFVGSLVWRSLILNNDDGSCKNLELEERGTERDWYFISHVKFPYTTKTAD